MREYRRTAGDLSGGHVEVRHSDEGTTMAIYSLFRNKPFEPEAISVLSGACADVCRTLGLRTAIAGKPTSSPGR